MITFQDKINLNTDPDIPEINKITDQNINDLKAGINANEAKLADTDWQVATCDANFKAYNNLTTNTPRYRKIGKIVEVKGVVAPKVQLTANTRYTIFTMPDGYKPSTVYVYNVNQGSGMNRWYSAVTSNGEFTIDRYGVDTAKDIPVGAWLPFHAIYMVD